MPARGRSGFLTLFFSSQSLMARRICSDSSTPSRSLMTYLSASQFSREYARLFGSAPTKDIARLRAYGFSSAEE